ncbi:hypothetical protein LJR125_000441 [Pseudoxanthomonas sp. LjRoot125]|uniref:hypothetical protein n=1 Tax=Pseudoxanthomonas sp. LjRoot125 TaxID=3342258 RepID=UPI003E11A2D6
MNAANVGNLTVKMEDVRAKLVAGNLDLQEHADSVLTLVPNLGEERKEVRLEIVQTLLCPYLADERAKSIKYPCGKEGPAWDSLRHRKKIVQAFNQRYKERHGKLCPLAVCMEADLGPVDMVNALSEWMSPLRAEVSRACAEKSVEHCQATVAAAALRTASALVVDEHVADALANFKPSGTSLPQGQNVVASCLGSIAKDVTSFAEARDFENAASGTPPLASKELFQNVARLWAATDQRPRQRLERRLDAWREQARRLRDGELQLDARCLKPSLDPILARATNRLSAPRLTAEVIALDTQGNLPALRLSRRANYYDFVTRGRGPLAAVRLRYSVADDMPTCRNSRVTGELSLILRYQDSDGDWKARELATGIDDLSMSGICESAPTLAYDRATLSDMQLRGALQQLLPAFVQIRDSVGELRYMPEKGGPGRLALVISARIGVAGGDKVLPVAWDLTQGSISFDRAELFNSIRPLLKEHLSTLLDATTLSFSPPTECPQRPSADSRAGGFVMYACPRLPAMTEPVLVQLEMDPVGRLKVDLPPDSIRAVQLGLVSWLERQRLSNGMRLDVPREEFDVRVDELSDGIRIKFSSSLTLGGSAVPWPVSLDLKFRGGIALDDQLSQQLRGLGDWAKAQAEANFLRELDEALHNLALPGIRIVERNIKERTVTLELSTPIQKLEKLVVKLQLNGDGEQMRLAMKAALQRKINDELSGETIQLPGVTLDSLSVQGQAWVLNAQAVFQDSPRVAVPVTLPLYGNFRPSMGPDAAKQALSGLLFSRIKELGGVAGQAFTVAPEWVDGALSLRIHAKVSLSLFGDQGFVGELDAHVAQGRGLVLDRIKATCQVATCWVPAGPFQVGGFSLAFDPEKMRDLAFGATVAITPAMSTRQMLRLDAQLTIGTPIVLSGQLILLDSLHIGRFSGTLNAPEGTMRMEGSFEIPYLGIPISRSLLELDGKRCVLVSQWNDKLLGVAVDIQTGLVFARCKRDMASASTAIAQIYELCQSAGPADVAICGRGEGEVLKQRVSVTATQALMPMGLPSLSATVEVLGINLSTEIRRSRVVMRGRAGGLASVTLILPPAGQFDRRQVEQLLRKLLEPKLSWDAIREREITLSLLPEGTSSKEADSAYRVNNEETKQDETKGTKPTRQVQGLPCGQDGRVCTTFSNGSAIWIDDAPCRIVVGEEGGNTRSWNLSQEVCTGGLKNGLLLNARSDLLDEYRVAIFCPKSGCAENTLHVSDVTGPSTPNVSTLRAIKIPDRVIGKARLAWTPAAINNSIGALINFVNVGNKHSDFDWVCILPIQQDQSCMTSLVVYGNQLYQAAWAAFERLPSDSPYAVIASLGGEGIRLAGIEGIVSGATGWIQAAGLDQNQVIVATNREWFTVYRGTDGSLAKGNTLSLRSRQFFWPPVEVISQSPRPEYGGILAYVARHESKFRDCQLLAQRMIFCGDLDSRGVLAGRLYGIESPDRQASIVVRSIDCLSQGMDLWKNEGLAKEWIAFGAAGATPSIDKMSRFVHGLSQWASNAKPHWLHANPALLVYHPPIVCE